MSEIPFALGACALVLSAPVLSLAAQKPPAVGSVALVIASPFGEGAARIAQRAGAAPIGPTRAYSGVFVDITSSNIRDRLQASGAWFVVPGGALLALCSG